jgi:methionyl-tRNA formyltransferase
MFSDSGVDTGPMLLKQKVPIGPDTTAEDLALTMSVTGASLIKQTLEQLQAGTLNAIKQDDAQATFAPRLTKEMGELDWSKSAQDLHNLVRGLVPWPGTWSYHNGAPLKIIHTRTILGDTPDSTTKPGTLIIDHDRVMVACGEGGKELLEILEVQPANKSKMQARDWVNGFRITSGTVLGNK